MKNLKTFAFAGMMAVVVSSTLAQADYYGRGGYGYGHGYRHGSGDGFVAGLLVSTAALFATMVTHDAVHHKELVYIGAADEAASFLQNNGGEPSALLREAIETERSFLVDAGHQEAADFSDEVLAEMVVGRAAQLNS